MSIDALTASLPAHAVPFTAVAPVLADAGSALDFVLPPELEATAPPEARGVPRDEVKLLVSVGVEPPRHRRFLDLPDALAPGDLLVVNTSATVPAAVDAVLPDGDTVEVHLCTRLPSGLWLLELRVPAVPASRPRFDDASGTTLSIAGTGATVEVLSRLRGSQRLWLAVVRTPGESLDQLLARHGRPIRYRHVPHDWPLDAYQTVFARQPGSAEMPSAARPFTPAVVDALVRRGVAIAPIVLHTGVSSLEGHEAPYPERYRVAAETAAQVNEVRAAGGRVIAAGTTVVRALESATGTDGVVRPAKGWTNVFITPARGVRAVDGLLTGWHEPEASHLLMLEAIAGRPALELAYAAAIEHRYLWHEFGDTHLILPGRPARPSRPSRPARAARTTT